MHDRELSTKLKFKHQYRQVIERSSIHMLDTVNTELAEVTGKVKEAVRCESCGTYHLTKENNEVRFFTLIGNLHANNRGGILGNSDWDANGVHVYHYCPDCLLSEIEKHIVRPPVPYPKMRNSQTLSL